MRLSGTGSAGCAQSRPRWRSDSGNDPPEKCSKDQREEIRLQIVLIDELVAMMKRDEASAKGDGPAPRPDGENHLTY